MTTDSVVASAGITTRASSTSSRPAVYTGAAAAVDAGNFFGAIGVALIGVAALI